MFNKFKPNNKYNFYILDEKIAKYLDIWTNNIRKRLNNNYSNNKKIFNENVDYVKLKKNNK